MTKKRGRIKAPKAPPSEKPLTAQEIQFCANYCDHGNQAQAFRDVWPDHKNPHDAARRLMKRPEIKHLNAQILEKMRERAADAAARAAMLTLDMADSRLAEVIQTRRRTRGEMFTRDTGELQDGGVSISVTPNPTGKGKPTITIAKSEDFQKSLAEPAPIEDTDLLKAIDLTYKRKAGFPLKPSEKAPPGPTAVFLYQPAWKTARQQQTLPAAAGEVIEAETA